MHEPLAVQALPKDNEFWVCFQIPAILANCVNLNCRTFHNAPITRVTSVTEGLLLSGFRMNSLVADLKMQSL